MSKTTSRRATGQLLGLGAVNLLLGNYLVSASLVTTCSNFEASSRCTMPLQCTNTRMHCKTWKLVAKKKSTAHCTTLASATKAPSKHRIAHCCVFGTLRLFVSDGLRYVCDGSSYALFRTQYATKYAYGTSDSFLKHNDRQSLLFFAWKMAINS